jgi:hypothetical protein
VTPDWAPDDPVVPEGAPVAAAPKPDGPALPSAVGERGPTPQPAAAPAGAEVTADAEPGTGAVADAGSVADPDEPIAATHRSTPGEREWLRRTLGSRYDAYAGLVGRLLAQRPGLRAAGATPEAVVTDLAALAVYLDASERAPDRALRSGRIGALRPYIGCMVSGLRCLPSYRGPALFGAQLDQRQWERYCAGAALREPAFVSALTTVVTELPGNVEIVVWSSSARRTAVLVPPDRPERVIFLPGSVFKVLAVCEAGGTTESRTPAPRRLFLREVATAPEETATALTEQDLAMLDRLTDHAARRDKIPESQRRPLTTSGHFDLAIGLPDHDPPEHHSA